MKRIVLVILVSGLAFFTRQTNNMNNINEYFKKSGAQFIKESISGWAEINTDDTPQLAAEKIFDSLSLQNHANCEWRNGMYHITASSDGMEVVIKTMHMDSEGSIYMYVEYSQHDIMLNINNMRRSLEDAFRIYDAEGSYSVLIQGQYNKKLTPEEMNRKTESIVKASSASYVDGMADGSLISVCAFSKLLPSWEARVVDGKKINLNIALRASETNSCTYIWIGYPIITIEY